MNTTQDRLGGFEERLLGELKRFVVATADTKGVRQPRTRVGWTRRVALAGGLAAVLAVAVAAGLPLLGGSGTEAYAVTRNADGSVTVEVSSLEDAAGLQRKLREAGIPASVQYIPPGKACKEQTFVPAQARGPSQMRMDVQDSGVLRFTLSRSDIPEGGTLVIFTQQLDVPRAGGTVVASSIGVAFAKGAVAPCELVDATSSLPPVPVGAEAGGGTLKVNPSSGAEPSLDRAGTTQGSG